MIDLNELRFDENGLIPAIVVDVKSRSVLMLAYMNEESLRISMIEGKTCFWSRSRNELWRKGETSGNIQHILSIPYQSKTQKCKIRFKRWQIKK